MILSTLIFIIFLAIGIAFINGRMLYLVAGYRDGKLMGREVNPIKMGKVVGIIVIFAGFFALLTQFIF